MGLRVGALTRSWARRALWAGLRGEKEGVGRATGLGKECGRGLDEGEAGSGRTGPRERKWAGLFWVWVMGSFSISFSLLFLIQTKFEFKYKFEFKPHSIKSMHSMNATQKLNL